MKALKACLKSAAEGYRSFFYLSATMTIAVLYGRETDSQSSEKLTGKLTLRQICGEAIGQRDRQTDRQTNMKDNTQLDNHTQTDRQTGTERDLKRENLNIQGYIIYSSR